MILPLLAAAALSGCTVHDGDGIRCGPSGAGQKSEKIRVANIDAPEVKGSPRCSASQVRRLRYSKNPPWCDFALGERSRQALQAFLLTGPLVIERRGTDRYGRALATLSVNGQDAGQMLISLGLARRWR